jgi:hypothetical protein
LSLRPSSLFFFPSLLSASSGHRQTDAQTKWLNIYDWTLFRTSSSVLHFEWFKMLWEHYLKL